MITARGDPAACRAFLDAHPDAELVLVGRSDALAGPAAAWPRCSVVPATEVVEMHDPVEVALRLKKDSSMRVAIAQLKPGFWPVIADAPASRRATPGRADGCRAIC